MEMLDPEIYIFAILSAQNFFYTFNVVIFQYLTW